jgi:hypothetical protein
MSINVDQDIIWHISKSSKRNEEIPDIILNDKRVKVYNVDCEDGETYKKRNEVFKNIQNGYFCFLDDDTIFHENMYNKYVECSEEKFVGMLVGEQLTPSNKLRLIASPPRMSRIDTGNVLSHWSCLTKCEWPEKIVGNTARDFLFWDSVYNFYGKKCAIWNQPISYYNKLSKENRWKNEKNLSQILKMNQGLRLKKN